MTFEAIEAQGIECFLEQIRDELIQRTYVSLKARQREIPKDGGGVRVLSIPAIRDRVVQGALKLTDEVTRCARQLRRRRAQRDLATDVPDARTLSSPVNGDRR